jgi:hypothetical protein
MRKLFATTLASMLLALLAVAPSNAEKSGGKVEIEKSGGKVEVAECWHYCIFIEHDLAAADQILSPRFVWHFGFARALAPGQEFVVGVQPAKDASNLLNAALSQLSVVHHAILSQGDLVDIRWTASGYYTGPGTLFDLPPTGCKIVFTGNDLFRIKRQQITELWQELDLLDLRNKLAQTPCPQ